MEILGLPLHPLVVHLAVVALPVGALALLASVIASGWRERYGVLSLATMTVGALAGLAAKVTGEALGKATKTPELHSLLGHALMAVGLATAALGWLWWFLERRRERSDAHGPSIGGMAAGSLAATAALVTVGLTVATGHTGATATWGKPAAGQAAPSASGTATAPKRYTLDEVKQHNSATSCWAAIDGSVYDLTKWAGQHPGGQQRILNLCGKDASEEFRTQHGTKPRPNNALAGFKVGELA